MRPSLWHLVTAAHRLLTRTDFQEHDSKAEDIWEAQEASVCILATADQHVGSNEMFEAY